MLGYIAKLRRCTHRFRIDFRMSLVSNIGCFNHGLACIVAGHVVNSIALCVGHVQGLLFQHMMHECDRPGCSGAMRAARHAMVLREAPASRHPGRRGNGEMVERTWCQYSNNNWRLDGLGQRRFLLGAVDSWIPRGVASRKGRNQRRGQGQQSKRPGHI